MAPVHDVNSFSPARSIRLAACQLQLVKIFTSHAILVNPVRVAWNWSFDALADHLVAGWPPCGPEGDVPVISRMTREAPLAEHRIKPLNLAEHPQEATAPWLAKIDVRSVTFCSRHPQDLLLAA
jgi:hypothetical protein